MKMPEPSAEFTPLSADIHEASCFEVVDFGTQEDTYQGKLNVRRKVWLGWEVPGEKMSDGRNFHIGREYHFSSSERSTFRKHLEQWRGRKFEDADFGPQGNFDVRNLLGVGCRLTVVHNDNGKAKVQGIMPLKKGVVLEGLTQPMTYFALEEFDMSTFNRLQEWMQDRIRVSPEFEAITGLAKSVLVDQGQPVGAAVEGNDETPF